MDAMVGMGRPRPFPSTTYPTARARRSCAQRAYPPATSDPPPLRRAALRLRLLLPGRRLAPRGPDRAGGGAGAARRGAGRPQRRLRRAALLPGGASRPASGRWWARRWCSTTPSSAPQTCERRRGTRHARSSRRPTRSRSRVRTERVTLLVETAPATRTSAGCSPPPRSASPRGRRGSPGTCSPRTPGGLCCLTGGEEGPLARALRAQATDAPRPAGCSSACARSSDGRLTIELQRHALRAEEQRNQALIELARKLRLPLVATNGVRYARREDKPLHDVLTCIRHAHDPRRAPGALLAGHRERHLKSAGEMARLFADLPEAVEATPSSPRALDFTLADLGYRFPDYPLPPGETPASYLRHLTWNGARARFRPLTAKAQAQIEKELDADREARPRRLLPDRLGHRPLLPASRASWSRAAARRPTARSATRSRSPPSTR